MSPAPDLLPNDISADTPIRVLLVEDNDGDYGLIIEHFKDADLDPPPVLVRAECMDRAVELLVPDGNGGSFDLVLLDLSLPDSHGPETFTRLKEVSPLTAICILSGNADDDLAFEMVRAGAQDYLSKTNLTGDLLGRTILYSVERQRARQKLQALNTQLTKATTDLQHAQMQLIQTEKLESLGRLASGVAHEVKNPLAILQMGVDYLLRRRDQADESGKKVLDNMQNAIGRADTIIRGMVDLSRSDDFNLKPCAVNQLVEDALRMVSHELLKRDIELIKDLTDPIPPVDIDRGKLEQVLINLMTNSCHAMPKGGVLKVRTLWGEVHESEYDEGLREMNRIRQGDEVVIIEIRDHGTGIPEHLLNRIYEPFFTTKPTGEGTGLGLSVAKKIVELHHGHIQIRNVINPVGLRVRILLKPASPDEPST